MAHHKATARPGRDRYGDSGYTEDEWPMPTVGEDRMESIYRNPVGAQSGMPLEGQQSAPAGQQSGGTRSPWHLWSGGRLHKVEPAEAAYEGSVRSRVSDDASKQGISSNSSAKESEGQRKVVSARPDATAGLNHSSKAG